MKWLLEKQMILLLLISVGLAGSTVFFYFQTQSKEKKIKQEQQAILQLKQKEEEIKTELVRLEAQYQTLYKEKNGTAQEKLLESVEKLFQQVYTYDTNQSSSSIENRRKEASSVVTDAVLTTIFPEEIRSSVQTKSKLLKTETYIRSSDSEQIEALVLVEFSTSIAGSQDLTGRYLYKIQFRSFENKIVEVSPLGTAEFLK